MTKNRISAIAASLVVLGVVVGYSCSSDNDSSTQPINANIIGTWAFPNTNDVAMHFYADGTWEIIGPQSDDGGYGTYTVSGNSVTYEGIGNWQGERLWGTGIVRNTIYIDFTLNSAIEGTMTGTLTRTSTTP